MRRDTWFAALTVLVMVTGCHAPESSDDRVLRRGALSGLETLDPHFALRPEAAAVLTDLYEGLLRRDSAGHLLPAAAERWSVSADGLRYTFELREDARWSDGSALTPEDFVWSFRRLVDPSTLSPHSAKLALVRGANDIAAGTRPPESLGITAADARTLLIELRAPASWFPAVLTDPVLVPLHRASVERADRWPGSEERLVSNGPYALVHRERGPDLVELARNPHYREPGRVPIARVRYIAFDDELAQFTAYRVAEIDLADGVPAQGFEVAHDQFPKELHARPSPRTFLYAFNLRHGALAGNPMLRHALSAALRRAEIAARMLPAPRSPAFSLIPPAFGGYRPAVAKHAGVEGHVPESASSADPANGHGLSLRMLEIGDKALARASVTAASMWRESLGIEIAPAVHDWDDRLSRPPSGAGWEIAPMSIHADVDDPIAFLEKFVSGSPDNVGGYSDPRFDELIAQSRAESRPERRFALLREAEQRLLDADAVAPVFFYDDRVLMKPWLDLGRRTDISPIPSADLHWR